MTGVLVHAHRESGDDALTGRGIGLLQTAATRWGVAPADIGEVV